MGRGKDKKILGSDLKNMSPSEVNQAFMAATRVTGTAVVRKKDTGEVVYSDTAKKGSYNEDKLS